MKSYTWVVLILTISASSVLCFEKFCDEGPCCENGTLLNQTVTCRPAANPCDVPDYCSGFSSECTLDVGVEEGTPCVEADGPGECYYGLCISSEVRAQIQFCDENCSKIHGICSQNGTCSCVEPWENPPDCDTKSVYLNDTSNSRSKLNHEMMIIDKIIAKRFRRSTGYKHHSSSVSSADNIQQQPVALPLSVQEPPKEDQWTKLIQNPVFGPVSLMVGASLVLACLAIWAFIIYRLEAKKQELKKRVKVRRRSSRQVPKETSVITDPSVNIDIGN